MLDEVNAQVDAVILAELKMADPAVGGDYYGDHIKAVEQLYRSRVDAEKVRVAQVEANNAKELKLRETEAKMIEANARATDAETKRIEVDNTKEFKTREMDAKTIEARARAVDAETKRIEITEIRPKETEAKMAEIEATKYRAGMDLAGKLAVAALSAAASGVLTVWCAGTILGTESPGPIRSKAFGFVTKFIPKI